MARVLNLVCWFITGAIAFTFIGYCGLVFPALKDLMFIGSIVFVVVYIGLWAMDDGAIAYFNVDSRLYHSLLIAVLVALVVAVGALTWYLI